MAAQHYTLTCEITLRFRLWMALATALLRLSGWCVERAMLGIRCTAGKGTSG